ncbi:6-bladed beta-propeller [uncultured Bacteroides sp.]|uniref:6-bladed beta-propeller n=1 Tax=uncultured Bacteroides sp. TaxID=162156 RepID=UPI002AAB849C|nr:6-bladed beta-propeller [uncultured Bacteroides sp.]
MKKIVHIIRFSILCLCVWGCSRTSPNDKIIQYELSLMTDSTITINVASCSVKQYPISKLIDSVRYVALENSDSALIGVIKNVKVTKDLIYVSDLKDNSLKCFDKNGKFIRSAFKKGNAPQKIAHFIDFDVDEDFLYVLDGAKEAVHFYDRNGNYIKKVALPFRAQKMKHLSNNNYLFELSPFGTNNNEISNLIVYTNDEFKPIKYYLEYVDGAICGVDFENQLNSTYFSSQYGNGFYERKDSSFIMRYYLDFDGKYFNRDKQKDGFREAIEQDLYFQSSGPLNNERYLLCSYTAGLRREGVLFVDLNDNKALFVKKLIQDRADLIDFSFSFTMGYDVLSNEFYGICNSLDLSDISANKENVIKAMRQRMPKEVQTLLLHEDGDKSLNQILLFYKLKDQVYF